MNDNTFPKMTEKQIFDKYSRHTKLFSHPEWQKLRLMEELVQSGHAVWLDTCPKTIQWLCHPIPSHILVETLLKDGRIPHKNRPPLKRMHILKGRVAAPAKKTLQGVFWASWIALCVITFAIASAKYPHLFR